MSAALNRPHRSPEDAETLGKPDHSNGLRQGPIVATELFLGLLFVWAGAGKALDPAAFGRAIENYAILPALPSAALALYLPWVEIVAGAALLLRRARAAALTILCALGLVFCLALGSAFVRGLDIHCGCFSGSGTGVVPALIRAILLTLASGLLLRLRLRQKQGQW